MKNRIYEYKRCAGEARKGLSLKSFFKYIDNQIFTYK